MPPPDTRADAGAMLGLFFYLTSSAATYTEDQLRDWLARGGLRPAAPHQAAAPAEPGAVRGPRGPELEALKAALARVAAERA